MEWREVRARAFRRLLFRFAPDTDQIEIMVNGQLVVIDLDDYRPPHLRRKLPLENTKQMCYASIVTE